MQFYTDSKDGGGNIGGVHRKHFLNDGDKSLEGFMPKIAVMGVGGAGTNAINLLQSRLGDKADFFVCNTDVQSLQTSTCPNRMILGARLTRGKGAGAKPSVGRAAAEDSIEEIMEAIKAKNIDMLILTGGEGGGTCTGAAPVIAKAARQEGILTIAVVTKPFSFEGMHRMAAAEQGIKELQEEVDTLVVIANDNLRSLTNGAVSFKKAFEIADTFLSDCVISFVSIIQETGLVNIDFADLCSVARDRKSRAIMGTGYAEGDNCGARAMEEAMSSLLLDFEGVQWPEVCNVLVCIHGSEDLGIDDVSKMNEILRDKVAPTANIITGTTLRTDMKNDAVRVFVFGTTSSRGKTEVQEVKLGRKRVLREDFRKDEPPIIEYAEQSFVGSRHALHEDVSEYRSSANAAPKPEVKKHKGFLSMFMGSDENDEDEDSKKSSSNFMNFFSKKENNDRDED